MQLSTVARDIPRASYQIRAHTKPMFFVNISGEREIIQLDLVTKDKNIHRIYEINTFIVNIVRETESVQSILYQYELEHFDKMTT